MSFSLRDEINEWAAPLTMSQISVSNATNSTVISKEDSDDLDYYDINVRLKQLLELHEIVRIILCCISLLLNIIILVALFQVRSRITTHYRLIISLAISDILVGGSVFFHYVRKIFSPVYSLGDGPEQERLTSMCAFLFIKALNTTGLNINLMNLMLLAIDHYMAIMRPLQYPIIMRRSKVLYAIVSIWVTSLILGLSDFFSAIGNDKWEMFNYCEKVRATTYQEEFTVFAIAPVCLGVIVYIYMRIYVKVHRHRIPGNSGLSEREATRHTKALITTLLNIGAFLVSWLPLCVFQITLIVMARTSPRIVMGAHAALMQATYHLYNLLIMHTIADPIIYTVRMKEVSYTS